MRRGRLGTTGSLIVLCITSLDCRSSCQPCEEQRKGPPWLDCKDLRDTGRPPRMGFSLPRSAWTLGCSLSTRPHCGREKNENSERPRFMTAWKKKLEKDGLIIQSRQFRWGLVKPQGIVWSFSAEKLHLILTVTTEIGDMIILVFRIRKLMLRELREMDIMIQLASSKGGLDSKLWCLLLLSNCKVVSNSLRPQGLQHPRLLCPPLSPGGCSDSCPLSQWCYLTVSSFAAPFSFSYDQ